MAIAPGDQIPDVEVRVPDADGNPHKVSSGELLGQGRVVLFAVPGAFTPGCTKVHLPGYVERADELAAKGVDKVVCTAVNDVWVMDAWAKAHGASDRIVMMADGNGDFARALGLEMDAKAGGLGVRSKRYAAVLEDGVVRQLDVDESGGIEVSACDAVLEKL